MGSRDTIFSGRLRAIKAMVAGLHLTLFAIWNENATAPIDL